MNKSMLTTFAAAVTMAAASAYGQAQPAAAPQASSAPADIVNLQAAAAQPAIEQVLVEPDGVAIALKENGDFQVFARGSGIYDASNPTELAAARNEATLNAKANLAKFIKEKVSSGEQASEVGKKTRMVQGDGKIQTEEVKADTVKNMAKTISTSSEAILQGVITLREQKVPGAGTGGQIQVTVGISSKTLEAVRRLTGNTDPAVVPMKNEGYIRNANTDF